MSQLPTEPLWHMHGRKPSPFTWRAPGDVDRAGPGPAARRLYLPGPLHEACRTGDLAAATALLDGGAGVDELDGVRLSRPAPVRATRLTASQGGHTALHFAAGYQQAAAVKLLLARGAALEPRDHWGNAPIDWTLMSGGGEPVRLLRAAALLRNEGAGHGKVAPLSTCCEHFYKCTDEEMAVRQQETLKKLDQRMVKRREQLNARPPSGVSKAVFSLKAYADAPAGVAEAGTA